MLEGAILGAAVSAASALYGGIKSAEAAREANQKVEDMRQENQTWYDRRYNEDPLQRSSAQRVLTKTAEMMRDRNKAAAGAAAVGGASEESVAATKQANAQGMAEAASRIVAADDARKDRIEQQYRGTNQGLTQQQIAIEQQRANNIAQATAGVGKAAGGLMSGIDGASSSNGPGAGAGATAKYLQGEGESNEEEFWNKFFAKNQTNPGRQNY